MTRFVTKGCADPDFADLVDTAHYLERQALRLSRDLFNCNGVQVYESPFHQQRIAYAANCVALAAFLRERHIRETGV